MEEIGNALRRTGRDDIVFKSLLANVISSLYPRKMEIISIQKKGNMCRVRVEKSIIQSELTLLSEEIRKEFEKKLQHLGLYFPKELKIVFYV